MEKSPAPPSEGIPHRIWRWLRNYFAFVGFLVTLSSVLFVVSINRIAKSHFQKGHKQTITISPNTELTLNLSGTIEQNEPGITNLIFARFFGNEHGVYMSQIRSALRRAGADDRVKGLQIELADLQGDAATFAELRELFVDFRAKDKKITAMVHNGDEWNYYLASVANRIVLNPTSPITIPGPMFQLIYLGEALRKIGVDIDVVRAGKFKSAFEPLVMDQPSEATLEQYKSMNMSLLGHIVDAVAKSRGKPPEQVRGWFKQTIFTSKDALDQGLVDEIGYLSDAPNAPAAVDAKPDPKPAAAGPQLALGDYAAEAGDSNSILPTSIGSDGIGLIEATGEIHMNDDARSEAIAPASMAKRIKWAKNEASVKAVVLRVSSPGGSAIASDMIWHDLQDLAATKPLIVSMGQYAASGGYYISVPAKKIFADPTTITGSIGVIGMLPSFEAFKEKYGVSFHIITESDRRAMLNPGTKASGLDKQLVETTIDQVYRQFLDRVSKGRKLPIERVEALAQGRVYTGLEAKDLGLVDEIGGLTAAFTEAKKLGGLDPTQLYPILHYEDDQMDLSQCLGSPSRLMRCFGNGGAHAQVKAADFLGPRDESELQHLGSILKDWLTITSREHALTLWTGYMTLRPL